QLRQILVLTGSGHCVKPPFSCSIGQTTPSGAEGRRASLLYSARSSPRSSEMARARRVPSTPETIIESPELRREAAHGGGARHAPARFDGVPSAVKSAPLRGKHTAQRGCRPARPRRGRNCVATALSETAS